MEWRFHETRQCPKCEQEYDAYTTGEHHPFVLQLRGAPMEGYNWQARANSIAGLGLFATIDSSACPDCVPDQRFLRESPEHRRPLVRPMWLTNEQLQ